MRIKYRCEDCGGGRIFNFAGGIKPEVIGAKCYTSGELKNFRKV